MISSWILEGKGRRPRKQTVYNYNPNVRQLSALFNCRSVRWVSYRSDQQADGEGLLRACHFDVKGVTVVECSGIRDATDLELWGDVARRSFVRF